MSAIFSVNDSCQPVLFNLILVIFDEFGSYDLCSFPPLEFKESVLTPEQIANNLRDEMKRLKKRREFRGQVGNLFEKYVVPVSMFSKKALIDILYVFHIEFPAGPPFPGFSTFLSRANGGSTHDGGAGRFL